MTVKAHREEAPKASEATLSLEDYLAQADVNPGLVASFKYEGTNNHPDMLEPKTKDGWDEAFKAQSNREYI